MSDLTVQPLFDGSSYERDRIKSLAERFTLPPASVLDTRSGWWQNRKREWGDMGLRSVEGRTARTFAKGAGTDEVTQKILALTGGQSIFDPVVAELMYRWYVPAGGTILDPFAGGSVRGIVAAVLGRRYVGVDLSADQVAANYAQSAEFVAAGWYADANAPEWIVGDSTDVVPDLEEDFDFVFSCPPYFDLEEYSDDPRDLSNMTWDAFERSYRLIITESVNRLRFDGFAAFVVGDVRDPRGMYRRLVRLTEDCFVSGGADAYNELIVVNSMGTLPLRMANSFTTSGKVGRCHQNVLMFVKGDPKVAMSRCDAAAHRRAVAMGRDD